MRKAFRLTPPADAGRSARMLRGLFYAAWAVGLVSLVNPETQPFSSLAIACGALLTAAGIMSFADRGRALATLSFLQLPPHLAPQPTFMAFVMVLVGLGWIGFGIALTVG